MKKSIKINYHPTDADADIVVDLILKAVDEAIEYFAAPTAILPKSFVSYMEKTDSTYRICCCSSLHKVLGDDEMKGGLDNTYIEPMTEGGWGDMKKMSLESYIGWISDVAKNNILGSAFIQYWLEDLEEYDSPGLAELMIKVNMRLLKNESVQHIEIREEVIEKVFYFLRKMAFED